MNYIYRLIDNPMMKKHLAIILPGIMAGIALYLYFSRSGDFTNAGIIWNELLLSVCLSVVIAYIIFYLSSLFNIWVPWRKTPGLRLLIGIVGCSLAAFSITQLAISIYSREWVGFNTYFQPLVKLAIILFILSTIFNIIYFALYSYHFFARQQIAVVRAERQKINHQLKALKNQLSPHFLFNCLNTISSLAYRNVDEAEKFVRGMASSYKYTLDTYEQQLIAVAKELSFVESYVFLLEKRYQEAIELTIDLSPEIKNSMMPPLVLQMLVENAVKHNHINYSQPLSIRISHDQHWIIVSNNRTNSPQNVTSFHIGLDNIRSRYELISGKKIIVEENDLFTVKLPVIR